MEKGDTVKTGDYVRVIKGNRTLGVIKNDTLRVETVTPLGGEYGHSVRLVLGTKTKRLVLFARHWNRLADPIINLNTGNPLVTVKIHKL